MLALLAIAALAAPTPGGPAPARIDLTLVDVPFALSPAFPSMSQSLDLAYGADRLWSYGIQAGFSAVRAPTALRRALEPPLALAFAMFVPTQAFVHEEWHRAVLTLRDVESVNALVRAPPDAEIEGTTSVWGISDADLVRLKRDHPADLVRAHAAGFEAHQALMERIERLAFLAPRVSGDGPLFHADQAMTPHLWLIELNTVLYLGLCTSEEAERHVREGEPLETDERGRDFTGPDCNGWVYDLFRPGEPYAGRGPHPTGEGISRYVAPSELTDEELRYLETQLWLRLVGLANPHLFFVDGVEIGGSRYGAHLAHVLAPWGFRIDAHGGWLRDGRAVLVTVQNGVSARGWMPGVEAEVVGLRLGHLEAEALAGVWLQPAEQLRYGAHRPGGRLAGAVTWRPVGAFGLRLGAEAKSTGFVMGNPWLDPMVGGTLATVLQLP